MAVLHVVDDDRECDGFVGVVLRPANGGVHRRGIVAGGDEPAGPRERRVPHARLGDRLRVHLEPCFVLYFGSQPLWTTHTKTGNHAVMQPDGNFVLYDASQTPLWNSKTENHAGVELALQNDGNLVVYAAQAPLWASSTCCH